MIEFDKSEYLQSTVEDGVLRAVLSLYADLPAMKAIALKDKFLYEGKRCDGLAQLPERIGYRVSEARPESHGGSTCGRRATPGGVVSQANPQPITETIPP